jgi:hypothetical protein
MKCRVLERQTGHGVGADPDKMRPAVGTARCRAQSLLNISLILLGRVAELFRVPRPSVKSCRQSKQRIQKTLRECAARYLRATHRPHHRTLTRPRLGRALWDNAPRGSRVCHLDPATRREPADLISGRSDTREHTSLIGHVRPALGRQSFDSLFWYGLEQRGSPVPRRARARSTAANSAAHSQYPASRELDLETYAPAHANHKAGRGEVNGGKIGGFMGGSDTGSAEAVTLNVFRQVR